MIFRMLALPLLVLAATPALAQAQDTPPPADTGGDFAIVGAGAGILPDYEGSDDYRWSPVPAAIGRVSGFNFQLIGNRLSVDLIPDGGGPGIDFQAGPVGVVNFNRTSTKSIDDVRVKALGEFDTAIELGGYVGVGKTGVITSDYDRLSVSVSYRTDVSGVSEAGILTPSISYMTPLSRKALVAVFASAERAENGQMDTYFGVTPGQSAASGLAAYNPDGGWRSWTLGAGTAISLTGDLTGGLQLVGGGTYRKLTGDAADSPIVRVAGSSNQWLGFIGLAFSF
jgi:outer membrane scaffolding protein for murein synthesis (MipA/OmpV family)